MIPDQYPNHYKTSEIYTGHFDSLNNMILFSYPSSIVITRDYCILLLLPRLPKLPSQCYSNGPGNLGNLGSNKEIQPQSYIIGSSPVVHHKIQSLGDHSIQILYPSCEMYQCMSLSLVLPRTQFLLAG